jgi:hypothetical protein
MKGKAHDSPEAIYRTQFDQPLLAQHGFDGMAQAIEVLMNEAMKFQRSEALGALPYQRTADRRGFANGFIPKIVNSCLGTLTLKVPKTRGVEFTQLCWNEASTANGP